MLQNWASLIDKHQLELTLLETLEAGKPVSETFNGDILETAKCIRWFAEALDKVNDFVTPTDPSILSLVRREPIGVVGAILPWNFSALMCAWKLGPALAMGNSVVVKPAHQTSLATLRIAELALEAGLPPGALNVVPGLGATAGQLPNDVFFFCLFIFFFCLFIFSFVLYFLSFLFSLFISFFLLLCVLLLRTSSCSPYGC